MKKLDFYIIKKYLSTFFVMLLLFIPIGIMVDIAEKVDKFKENEVPLKDILNYYVDFTWYFGNLLFPIFLFLSVIWFTSKLANNSEIIAILSSGISFFRFLRPYFISATFISIFALFAGMFIIPNSNKGFNEFNYKHLNKKSSARITSNLYKQINENEFIYVSNYDPLRLRANNFTLEHFDGNKLIFKISSQSLRWIEDDSIFRLIGYKKRSFRGDEESYETFKRKDTIFDFKIDDLSPVSYKAETLNFNELNEFIKDELESGSTLINTHLLVRHKRWSIPLSSFVLTLIAVSVSSFKRRGGMGINLAFGIGLGFIFIFFEKIFGVLVTKSSFSPHIGAWLPFFIFLILAIILLNHAKK